MVNQTQQAVVSGSAQSGVTQSGGAPDPVFALDIGTRSIIGVVGVPEGDLFHVLAIERMDHPKRAMIDGQIEDIEQTARVASAVKTRLEKRLGRTLRDVYVAAAGRALKTQRASFEAEIDPKEAITAAAVSEIEMQAVQKAYEAVGSEEGIDFYCVGYTAVRHLLDGYPISTLQGHRGKRVHTEIIATFLPNAVVESLYATMTQTGLSVASLTLEPIAAMNAIIPKELRLLNLALVDIGAGTSDIAVSREGTVAAYTMATVAGDEITEAIIKEYLVDFQTAEDIKLSLGRNLSEIKFHDILGVAYSVPGQEILGRIAPAVDELASTICERILEVNGQTAPAAVFLVGGGSQLPGLCDLVAEKLSIDRSKVAVGSNNYMKKAVVSEEDVSGPDFATPMGIAITAMLARERDRFTVHLNGESVTLMRSGSTSVMDVLLFKGYKHSQIIGRSGKSVTFELNGEKRTVRGSLPVAATLTVGGKAASLSTPLRPGDSVEITPAVSGVDAAPTLGDVVEGWEAISVRLNGEVMPAGTVVTLNGETVADPARVVGNQDVILVRQVRTLGEFLREHGVESAGRHLYVNDVEREEDFELSDGDDIGVLDSPHPAESVPPEPAQTEAARPLPPVSDGTKKSVPLPRRTLRRGMTISLNGEAIALLPREDGAPYQFVDMLNFVDIDPNNPQGSLVLRLNGRPASYLDTVNDGDQVEIGWEQ